MHFYTLNFILDTDFPMYFDTHVDHIGHHILKPSKAQVLSLLHMHIVMSLSLSFPFKQHW
jgi:hypothetical protein